ncbi:MAG: hypothetical protein NC176_08905 [Treponema brennaborense]|nr:hypothetical protein [Prevotella sp.]MCM1408577.1 hypothetical protein [Treponema brennaborense]
MIFISFVVLLPYILLLAGGSAEPFDESVQKNRNEALSLSGNLFLEILFYAGIVLLLLDGIYDINISAGAVLMFAAALRCFLQCLFFGAIESRSRHDAEELLEDA